MSASNASDDEKEQLENEKKIKIYKYFILFFWAPFLILIIFNVSGTIALSAAIIGVLPLLLLFFPLFNRLLERLSSVKVGNVELAFKEAITESLKGDSTEQITYSLDVDAGAEDVIYGKAGMVEFYQSIQSFLPTPKKKLVISIDLKEEGRIDLPMLYYQARVLSGLFNLRAFLFIDTSKSDSDERILGALTPNAAIAAIENYLPVLGENYKITVDEINKQISRGELESFINEGWQELTNSVQNSPSINRALTKETYRVVFSDKIEKNVLAYPLVEKDYPALLKYLGSENHLLILMKDGVVVNVRTISVVAREIARLNVIASMKKEST